MQSDIFSTSKLQEKTISTALLYKAIRSYLLTFISLLFLPSASLSAGEDHHHDHEHEHHHDSELEFVEHDSHQHGLAEATFSFSDNKLLLNIQLPAADIYGFEHKAQTDEEKLAIKQAEELLTDTNTILSIDNACKLGHHRIHDTNHHGDDHSNHYDVEIESSWSCQNTDAFEISFNLFDHFSSIKEIMVQYISDTEQNIYTITADKNSIEVK